MDQTKNINHYTPYDWLSFIVGSFFAIFFIFFSKNVFGIGIGTTIFLLLLNSCFKTANLTDTYILYKSIFFGKKKKILWDNIKAVEFRGGFKAKRNYVLYSKEGGKIKFFANDETVKIIQEICDLYQIPLKKRSISNYQMK
ncbi:hypothetical protein [Fluviicola chungangensis]|uniref:PH domain-containing protein n=1 Tax=Fluviicola chungangensis TaxID=2597671 RepID=A0A556MPG6_9FLAO|nr:hypothetical protein [Fluviicola chungangensis]TSJ41857.1 hypothetical protein FO442_12250 [Fluviicola chungangensis]